MATAVMQGSSKLSMFNRDARLGDDTIGPGLLQDLQKFYEKTDNLKDKAKCMELVDAVRMGQASQPDPVKRPYTAFPSYHGQLEHAKNFLSPYQTSYNRDYPLKQPIDSVALRPMTSHGFPPQDGPGPDTHYQNEYNSKPYRPMTPLRPGSASGNRANNPHPLQSFLIWKFPRKGPIETEGAKWSEELTDDKMNQVHKRLCQSTYQQDYLGVPQGFEVKSAYALPPDWKENIPYTLDSVQRYSYQNSQQPDDLQLPVTRYGSNRKKQIPASGTIPTASRRQMHIRNRSTYDRHYNDNADAVSSQIRDLGQKLGAEAIRKYYESSGGEDRAMARQLYETYAGRRITPSPQPPPAFAKPPSGRPSSRAYKSNTPACTPISPYVPAPPPMAPSSRMSFNVYSPPQLLE